MTEVAVGVVLALGAVAVVIGAVAGATWFGWWARAQEARADDAERGKAAADAAADYERGRAAIEKEGEDRAREVDARGIDRARIERLLRGGDSPPPAA